MAPQNIQAAELSKNQHSRDFWRRSIFDFFNRIDPKHIRSRQQRPGCNQSATHRKDLQKK